MIFKNYPSHFIKLVFRFIYNFISKLSLSLNELYNIPMKAKLVILPGLVKSIWIMFFNGSTIHSPNQLIVLIKDGKIIQFNFQSSSINKETDENYRFIDR